MGFTIKNTSGVTFGTLKDIMWLPSNDVYVIDNNGKEYLIPVISEIVKSINYDKGSITIVPIDGLLE